MSKAWKIVPRKKDDLMEQLLFNRGIKTEEEKELFFKPKVADFSKDLQIKNIDIAKKRILKAIKKEELIFVSGDYDVDGICGAAVLYLGLTKIGAKVLPYIPHREKEGYGLSEIGLDYAKEKGAKLVISVDCGIVDFKEADYAKKLGLDLIITDHHQPMNKKPKSFTIVHSTKICGTAVGWWLVKALVPEEVSRGLLDLVAIATIADMMPMQGINRALVREGLEELRVSKKVGLLALVNDSKINIKEVGAYEIGHVIAPRINALGRLDHAMDALRLLCTKNPSKAGEFAKRLSEVNDLRKKMTVDAIEIARLKIVEQSSIHVLADESWNPGIVGLVAGRIVEETGKPAIAIAIGTLESRGSARSSGIDIIEVIRKCSDILIAVGGHPGAAGFTIHTTKIEEFQKRIVKLIDESLMDEPVLEIDAKVESSDLSEELAKKIEDFDPFGVKNPKPVLATFGMRLEGLKTVGGDKHLKGKADGIDFVFFNKGELINLLLDGTLADLVYNLEINRFNGSEKLQLIIKDMKL